MNESLISSTETSHPRTNVDLSWSKNPSAVVYFAHRDANVNSFTHAQPKAVFPRWRFPRSAKMPADLSCSRISVILAR